MLLNEGLTQLATQTKSDLANGQWGTGTTTPAPTDTGLETPVVATLDTVTTSSSGASVTVNHLVESTEANGSDLTEFEVQFTNGDSLLRVVGGAISKTSSIEVKTIVNINFVRV